MSRRLSGFKPTGHLHLGTLLGAIRPTVAGQAGHDTAILVVDLHGMTVEHEPARLRELTLEVANLLLAAGVDPARSLFYVQSHVPEHAELHYLLECVTGYGEAHRMIQFKEKAATQQHVRLSLLTYPTLMAADILIHDTEEVPVGADQAQHVELARDIAVRFNGRYGPTFTVPKAVNPGFTARLRELSDPGAKMGKTNLDDAGVLYLLDPPEVIRRKVMRAVTDTGREVRYDPEHQPGVANLLDILAGCRDETPTTLAGSFGSYRALKEAVADTVIATVRPIQTRYAELRKDDRTVHAILRQGAAQAREQAQQKVREVRARLGLLP
jgi:tryptophanyl-tRNA synthetase